MRYSISALAALVLVWTAPLAALPAQIVLMRHAETEGLDLSLKGKERAVALAPFFQGAAKFLQVNLPTELFAQGVSDASSPLRSLNTLVPLSYALSITIHTDFMRDQYKEMVQAIKTNPSYNGKLVIICWGHDVLAEMASAFGAKPKPAQWDTDVYDRLWVITYKPDGEVVFQDMPQRLLFGDSPN